jgi:integrase
MRTPYRTIKRRNRAGKVYFQVRFLAEDGVTLKSKSYPEAKTRAQACRFAEEDLKRGILPSNANPSALESVREFWSESSPYFKSRALKGRPLSESYRQSGLWNLKHFETYLEGKLLADLTAESLEEYADGLAGKGINPRTINLGIEAIRRPYSVFCKKHHLANALAEVEHHEQKPRERGILTPEELSKIIQVDNDPRARLAVLLGALCGLRKGEVRGLQFDDVDFEKGTLSICHNVVFTKEGVKAPKCGSSRIIPAPELVLKAIWECRKLYPAGHFVIPNFASPDKPCNVITVGRAFYRILDTIGIDADERKRRNLVFHGLRHTFVSLSQNAGIPDFIVARLSGHKGLAMVQRYTHSEGLVDFQAAREAMEKAVAPKAQKAVEGAV